jgi:flavorubredoxin
MSAKIGLFYGSTTGKTDAIAELIRDEFGSKNVRLHCISEARDRDFAGYDYLIVGSPTWGIGAWLLVAKAMFWGGLFDPWMNGGEVDPIITPIELCNWQN